MTGSREILYNAIINDMYGVGFLHLESISDPYDFKTEGTCYFDFGVCLKISISGSEHQLFWNIKIDRKDIVDIRIFDAIISRLIINKYKIAGAYIHNTESIGIFIEVMSNMKTQAVLIKELLENFLNQHGKEVNNFQEKIKAEVYDFSKTLFNITEPGETPSYLLAAIASREIKK